MGENSSEYRTLVELTSQLRLAVKSDITSVSGELVSCGLISPDNDSELRNKMHSEADRAARLVELVQNKVLLDSQHYHTFIGILQSNWGKLYSDILQKLDQTYSSYQPKDGK